MRDDELMAALATGEAAALGELYDRHARAVYAFALGLLRNTEAARDVVQETFIKVLLARGSYRPGGRFKAWLFAIARNTARDAQRAQAREQLSSEEEDLRFETLPHAGPSPADELAGRELAEVVARAVERLPEPFRESILLAKYAGLPYGEIARRQGVSVGTVKARVFRAVARLRKSLAREVEL